MYRRIFLSIFLLQLTTNLELTPKLCGQELRLPIAIVIRIRIPIKMALRRVNATLDRDCDPDRPIRIAITKLLCRVNVHDYKSEVSRPCYKKGRKKKTLLVTPAFLTCDILLTQLIFQVARKVCLVQFNFRNKFLQVTQAYY